MRLLAPAALLLVASLGPGCNTEYANPFAVNTRTVAPPSTADLIFTSNTYSATPGQPRDVFSVSGEGAGLTRLTFCNQDPRHCDTVEAAPASDRHRLAMRRITTDTSNDGRLTSADGEGIVVVDLTRGVEGQVLAQTTRASSIDWSPAGDVLVFGAAGEGSIEDLFRADANGANNRSLTATAAIRERRARIDPTGSVAVYERIDNATGKGEVWIFNTSLSQVRVTSGGTGSTPLPGTPYVVGADADPDYSPDGRSIVFRRMTGLGVNGLGAWDVMTVRTDGTSPAVIATGPFFRGAPDWGPQGIAFTEVGADGASRLVVMQPDGSGRRVAVTVGAGFEISFPRWLP